MMIATLKKAGLPTLVLLAAAFTGCYFDLGKPIDEGQGQPSQGVLTVKGLEDGSHYEAEVYDYPDDDIADDDDLNDIMSQFELAAIGLGTVGNGTLELTLLVPPEGEFFIADGSFLVVLKVAKNNSAPLMYKAAVPFTGGSATVEYDDMETAIVEQDDPNVSSYTVKFDLNYTGAPKPPANQKIKEGSKATLPTPAPTRDGYTLDGWYTSKDYTMKWDFDSPVTADITLYARWLDNSIIYRTVTFHTNGGTPADFTQTVADGGKVTQPADPTRDGHTFGGWFTNAPGTGAAWDFDTDTVTENIILYAKWAVWLESGETTWSVTNGSAVSISSEQTTESEYISYTDETHYTYKASYHYGGTTIYENERSRNGESEHEVYITRYDNENVYTDVYDRVYDTDSGLLKQQTRTETYTSSGVTSSPSVTESFYTVTLLDTDDDGTKTYKRYVTNTGGTDGYYTYTIKDGVTLSHSVYTTDDLDSSNTYTFPDNPVIRERLPTLTLLLYTRPATPSFDSYEACELLASTDTSLTVRIKWSYTSTNVLTTQRDYTYTKKALPVGPAD
jgi:uncharacterized repeat protein (TIGR02543 family)